MLIQIDIAELVGQQHRVANLYPVVVVMAMPINPETGIALMYKVGQIDTKSFIDRANIVNAGIAFG